MDQKWLVIDCETGGLDPSKHSLLSIAGIIWEPGKSPRILFDFFIKESLITIEPEAMEVNRIHLSGISRFGISPEQAIRKIKDIVIHEFKLGDKLGYVKVPLAGHNVGFDIGFLKRLYRLTNKESEFSKLFSHQSLDTASILSFLMCSNHIQSKRPSSNFLFEYCKVTPPEEARHTALGDAMATANALNVLVEKFGEKND